MAAQTVTIETIQIKRSSAPGVVPDALLRGQEFVNFADGIRLIGDGRPVAQLERYPLVTQAMLSALGGAAKGANADITSLSGTSAAPGVDIAFGSTAVASAATVDLGAIATVKAAISGTTTITSFGAKPHAFRMLRFSGVLTLTHNAATLVLPGGVSVLTAPGDTALFTSDGSGNWTCRHYQRAASDISLRSVGTVAGTVAAGDDGRITNAQDRRVLVLAADPTPSDIPAGTIRAAKNTSTGRISLWVNDGGSLVDLLTFTTA